MSVKLNLPNKLSLLRVLMIPLFVVFAFGAFFSDGTGSSIIWRLLAVAIFAAASFTDYLDGHIARKRNLITDFGKFLDPLADKVLIFAALIMLTVLEYNHGSYYLSAMAVATIIVIFREMAVTSLRLAASGKQVIAAGRLGKIKTVAQMIFIMVALIEPLLAFSEFIVDRRPATLLTMTVMLIMTVWSGIDYFKAYLPLLDTDK